MVFLTVKRACCGQILLHLPQYVMLDSPHKFHCQKLKDNCSETKGSINASLQNLVLIVLTRDDFPSYFFDPKIIFTFI